MFTEASGRELRVTLLAGNVLIKEEGSLCQHKILSLEKRFSFVGREFFISNGEEEEDFQCRRGKKRKTFSVEEGRRGKEKA